MVNLGFWSRLAKASRDENKPILCLAPMADVTDSAFRFMIAKCSKEKPRDTFSSLGTDIFLLENSSCSPQSGSQGPLEEVSRGFFNNYVTWTEFVSADGLVLAHEEGKKKLLKDLEYSEIERPIVAQLFGSRPENMRKAAYLAVSLGFDGVDINMGCPDKSVEKQGAGAAMIKNPELAREVIRAAKEGVAQYANESGKDAIPVSVKTRLGYNKDELEEWLPQLLAEEPAVITIHARTRKEMSKVPARWERIKRAVEIRDEFITPLPPLTLRGGLETPSPLQGEGVGGEVDVVFQSANGEEAKTLIFGNGDVLDIAHAESLARETGADGVMLGRAIFGNPWLYASEDPRASERLEALKEHIILFDKNLGGVKSFAVMKKHFKSYLSFLVPFAQNNNMENELKDLKDALLNSTTAEEAIALIDAFIPKTKA